MLGVYRDYPNDCVFEYYVVQNQCDHSAVIYEIWLRQFICGKCGTFLFTELDVLMTKNDNEALENLKNKTLLR